MQMRPGRQAGHADIPDHRTLVDALAGLDLAKPRHMAVQRAVVLAVVQDHHVAVAALGAHEHHPCIARRHDRRTGSGRVVHALVHAHRAQYRVLACAKGRADPAIGHRHADEALLQRAPGDVEIFRRLARALEAEAGIGLAAGDEGGRQDVAGADPLAFAPGLVHHHAEAVARLQILIEVDVVLEDIVGHHRDRRRGEPGFAGRGIQRAGDLAAGHHRAGAGRPLGDVLAHAVAQQAQLHPVTVVAIEAQRPQLTGGGHVEGDFRAGAQLGQRLLGPRMRQHLVHHGRRDAQLPEQGAQRLPGLDLEDLPVGARPQCLAAGYQRRQRQCQGGMAGKRRIDGI